MKHLLTHSSNCLWLEGNNAKLEFNSSSDNWELTLYANSSIAAIYSLAKSLWDCCNANTMLLTVNNSINAPASISINPLAICCSSMSSESSSSESSSVLGSSSSISGSGGGGGLNFTCSMSVDSVYLEVGNNFTFTVHVELNGVPVFQASVQFSSTDGGEIPTGGATDTNGNYSTQLSDNYNMPFGVTICGFATHPNNPDLSCSTNCIDVEWWEVDSSTSTTDANPTTVLNDGVDSSTITVTVRDNNGNILPGRSITLTSDTGNPVITPTSGTTNGSGVVTFSVTDTFDETATFTPTDDASGIQLPQVQVTFTGV